MPRAATGPVASVATRLRCAQVLAGALLLLSAVPPDVLASADLQYRVWTTEEGLPQGSALAIAQTRDGYIWIATRDGLVRFDGVRMRVFSKSDVPEMRSNRCLSLLVDRRGALWVGTEDAGVVQIEGTRIRSFDRASGLPSDVVFGVAEDPEGRIWAMTSAGPAVFERDRWKDPPPNTSYPESPTVPKELQAPTIAPAGLRRQDLRIWTEGARGRLWMLDNGILHRHEGGTWQTFSNPVPAVVLPSPLVLFEDREGTLWIGSDQGLVQAIPTAIRAVVPEGLPGQRNVYTIAGDAAGRLWITTQDAPLIWERGALQPLEGRSWWPPSGWMTSIEPDVDGSVLAGGPDALYRIWPGRGFQKLRAGSAPRDFLRDRLGVLWVALEDGLVRQSASGWDTIQGLPSNDVRVLLEASDGALWVGTYGGLVRVDGKNVRTWTTADGLSSDRIRALHEDESGALWIGTYDGGLNRFANNAFVPIRKRDGLFDDGVFAILDGNDGRYYMSSNRGIYSVAKADLDAFALARVHHVTYRAWRSSDGMPSSECNGGRQPSGFRAADGTLWFPTQRGIAVLDPRGVPENTLPPPLVVEEVTTNRRTISPGQPIRLAPGERMLEVRYTANTFIRPDMARFRHRLVGLDPDWIEAGNRRLVQYSSIPPGSYVLRILAANSDGVWNTDGVTLTITVDPYWWEARWFRGAAALVVVAGLTIGYRRRVSALTRRQVQQEAFARQLLDSQEAERKRIASELHDGIGQTLAIIRNRAALGLRDGSDPAALHQIQEIADAAGDAIEEVRKVAYALRPYQLDRLGLKRALESLVEQAAAASGLSIAADIGDVDGLVAKEDEINVYRIVQESLNNIVRHARATSGRVEVAVREREIEVRIDDDGAGFDPSAVSGGLGLTGIAERARILGGRATIRSAPGRGTTVLVHLSRI